MRTKLTWLCLGALMAVLALGAAQHVCREAQAMPRETANKKYTPSFAEWVDVYLCASFRRSNSGGFIYAGVGTLKSKTGYVSLFVQEEIRCKFICRYRPDTKLGQEVLLKMGVIRTKCIPTLVKSWQAKGYKIKVSDFEYDIKAIGPDD